MKHIILQFTETPADGKIDLSITEYDRTLNLNVVKGTTIPAVNFADESTQTFTKANGEGFDSDSGLTDTIATLMHTSTQTRVHSETSDSDPRDLAFLLDTNTQTFVHAESSDSDKNFRDVAYLSQTRTLTENREVSDNDQ